MTSSDCGGHEAGVVLVVALLVLLLTGVIAAAVSRTNQLQLHMAGNDEARIAAMQQALAVIDGVYAHSANFRTDVGVGRRNCQATALSDSCDAHSLSLEQGLVPAIGRLEVAVQRLAPDEGRMPVLAENAANSAVHYRVARFEVQVLYEDAADRGGRAALAQGVLIRLSHAVSSGGGI